MSPFLSGPKFGFDVNAEYLCKTVINVYKVLSATVGDIKRVACHLVRSKTSFEVRFNNIVDISKVSALLTVAVDCRHLAAGEKAIKLGVRKLTEQIEKGVAAADIAGDGTAGNK